MFVDNVALSAHCMFTFTVSLTPAATAAASAVEQAFTIAAANLPPQITLQATDQVDVSGPGSGNNVAICGSRVNATGQLVIQFINPTAGSLTHAAGTFVVAVTRP